MPVDTERSPSPIAGGRVVSIFAEDEDFREILEVFVEALGARRRSMQELLRAGDLVGLHRLAHQLKGSGAGYGFPELSKLAASLETACDAGDPARAGAELVDLLAHVSRIVPPGR